MQRRKGTEWSHAQDLVNELDFTAARPNGSLEALIVIAAAAVAVACETRELREGVDVSIGYEGASD
jgi:hypothetical protein